VVLLIANTCKSLRKIRIEAYVRHIDASGESECASLHYVLDVLYTGDTLL